MYNMIMSFEEFSLNEAKRNYKTTKFIRDMKNLGWEFEPTTKGDKFFKEIISNIGKKETLIIPVHIHNNEGGTCIDPKAIQFCVNLGLVKEYRLTGDMTFIDEAPWGAWGLKKPKKEQMDNPMNFQEVETQDDIADDNGVDPVWWANNRYNKCELEPLVNYGVHDAGDMQLMIKKERKKTRYNICDAKDDRVPLSCIWFDEIWQDDKDERLPNGFGLARELKTRKETNNGENMYAIYPVTKDGVITNRKKIIFEQRVLNDFKNNINE